MPEDIDKISNFKDLLAKVTSNNFDKINRNFVGSEVPKNCLDGSCILGVDEAGRGPVLGPMVYAVFYCHIDHTELVKSIGCTDSKELTEKKREEIFDLINDQGENLGWVADVISPNFISNNMLKRAKFSLNEIAQNSTIKLIESVLDKNIEITEIYVDTIGPPEKYQEKLSKLFPHCKVVVEKKADSKYPIVGAASICAKVIRDTVVQNWRFPEKIDFGEIDFGTGYPGDPKTKQFLSEFKDDVFGFSNFVRFSWSTAGKLLENCVRVEWEDEEEANRSVNQRNISSFFTILGPSQEPKHTPKSRFFKERLLNNVEYF